MPAHAKGIAKTDETLLAHEEHLKYRFAQYVRTKEAIERREGSLAEFAKVRRSRTAGCPVRSGARLPAFRPALGVFGNRPQQRVVSARRAWPLLWEAVLEHGPCA
jgi:hypothetical protein